MTRPARPRLPSTAQLTQWRDVIETSERLRRILGHRMQQASGISFGDYLVMLALSEADGKTMRSSAVATQLGWDRSRLSHHLGRMEKRGLIQRMPCAEDSRGTLATLTEEGRTVFRRATVPHLRDVRALFLDAFAGEELEQFSRGVKALSDHLERIEGSPGDVSVADRERSAGHAGEAGHVGKTGGDER